MPILLFQFTPDYSGFDFIYLYFLMYGIILGVYLIVISIDVLRYGVPILLKMGGLDLKDPKTNLAYQKIMKRLKNGFR